MSSADASRLTNFANSIQNLSIQTTPTQNKTYTMEEARSILDNYDKKIAELPAQIKGYEEVINQLKSDLLAAQRAYDTAESNYKKEENNYNKLSSEQNTKSIQYKNVTNEADILTYQLEQKDNQYQTAYNTAERNYNADEDGDFNTYMSKAMEGVEKPDSSDEIAIQNLKNQAGDIKNDLNSISTNMTSTKTRMSGYKSEMQTAKSNINSIQSNISAQEKLKAIAVSELKMLQENLGEIVLASLSPAEKALVTKKNIDLTEKYPNGSNRYILARGRGDNLYHIYEISENGSYGTSLARMYGKGGGYDIVSDGNGKMSNISSTSTANISNMVITLSSVSKDLTTCTYDKSYKDYSTSSPLSLDINGDGVKTSDKIIQYDIDGDGKLDNINDSADAVLVFDADGDGISGSSGLECFGDNTDLDGDGKSDGFKDGFQALKAFAEQEGLINENKSALNEDDIKFLEEKYGFKLKMNGYNDEAVSLLSAGITQIDFSKEETTSLKKNFDGQQNDIMTQEGATFTINGQKHEYADIWHSKKNV